VSNVLLTLDSYHLESKHIVISSTVLPGYYASIGKFLLQNSPTVSYSYSPCFVAQGDIMSGFKQGGYFGMVLIGTENAKAEQLLSQMYVNMAKGTVPPQCGIMSVESAEIAKLASNCFRTLKISFANFLGDLADATPNADKHAICTALGKDASIGTTCMRPGYGYGGPCYVRDNAALAHYANSVDILPAIPLASDSYNKKHAEVMADHLLAEEKAEYVFEGVAYKPNCPVPMIDNSQKLVVAKRIADRGKRVIIRDSLPVIQAVMKEYGSAFRYEIK
jgi:UDPglucose 6-dehydrogenase